jgi:threonine/homoserine/homoserine lactone efflux protein
MPIDLYLSFIFASVLLILMPGPMVALIVANSAAQGARGGLITVAGAASAMIVHLTAVCLGLAVVLAGLGEALFWLKWAGAAYLLYLGISALTAKASLFADNGSTGKSVRRIYLEALLVQLTNPKVLMFYAAFFPVFISPDHPVTRQLLVMSVTFLAIEVVLDLMWAIAATRARGLLRSSGRWGNRVTGALLVAAAVGTAALRKL